MIIVRFGFILFFYHYGTFRESALVQTLDHIYSVYTEGVSTFFFSLFHLVGSKLLPLSLLIGRPVCFPAGHRTNNNNKDDFIVNKVAPV